MKYHRTVIFVFNLSSSVAKRSRVFSLFLTLLDAVSLYCVPLHAATSLMSSMFLFSFYFFLYIHDIPRMQYFTSLFKSNPLRISVFSESFLCQCTSFFKIFFSKPATLKGRFGCLFVYLFVISIMVKHRARGGGGRWGERERESSCVLSRSRFTSTVILLVILT